MYKPLELALKSTPVVYVTRDLERAIGIPETVKNYYIVTNWSESAKRFAGHDKNILYITEKAKLDTRELLEHQKTIGLLGELKNPRVLVFKNTPQIEKICQARNWTLLNPPAQLANTVEEKISQLTWLGPLVEFLPPHKVTTCKNLEWTGEKFIIQFNRAHTGSGTILVENENQIIELRNIFPNREVRVTTYIDGPAFTNNNIVWGNDVLIGNINYQITGLSPFTNLPFATVGNDWELPHKLFTAKQHKAYQRLARAVGQRLAAHGWKGLFGLDTIIDEKTGQLYLIEINARQPASTTYESLLQRDTKRTGFTTFEAHLAALLGLIYDQEPLAQITTGAQIIQRVTPELAAIDKNTFAHLDRVHANYLPYKNTDLGSDLLRIQVKSGIMTGHGIFNMLGTEIAFACDTDKHRGYRAGLFLVRNKQLLLMKRHYHGERYFSIPGGKPEPHETLIAAAMREGKEETSLRFRITKQPPVCVQRKRREVYFYTTAVTGEAVLGGPELAKNTPDNHHELMWVDKKTLRTLRLRQSELKPILLKLL